MHTMTLVEKLLFWEEWECPICKRHIIMIWFPRWRRFIIKAGDETVGHSGMTGFDKLATEEE